MLIIVDQKIPNEAKKKLRGFGDLMELETSGITYPAISGHPDIFFNQVNDKLIVAPNLPPKYFQKLQYHQINFETGQKPVGRKYPETAAYNAVVTPKYLIHQTKITDPSIIDAARQTTIHVNQGYTRCNLIFPDDEHAITTDPGIKKALDQNGIETLYLMPDGIVLPGFDHGFIGGCCGLFNNQLFLLGNLNKYAEGYKLKSFLEFLKIDRVELCDMPLFDGGGIFFIE
jgi:hypothetical protein